MAPVGGGQICFDHIKDAVPPEVKEKIWDQGIDPQTPMMVAGVFVIQLEHLGTVAEHAKGGL